MKPKYRWDNRSREWVLRQYDAGTFKRREWYLGVPNFLRPNY